KNNVPLNKFPIVIQLGQALEFAKIISNTNSITYENSVSGRDLLSAIALSIEEKICKRQETLRQYQTILDHPVLKIRQIHEIRWLSWYEA
ncbi:11570_t:CDS:2, partial [Funneliformis geosporum]